MCQAIPLKTIEQQKKDYDEIDYIFSIIDAYSNEVRKLLSGMPERDINWILYNAMLDLKSSLAVMKDAVKMTGARL